MKISNLLAALVMAASFLFGQGVTAAVAADEPVVEVNCICKEKGGKRYSGHIHVTDSNRDAVAQSIRDGHWELGVTVLLRSVNCSEEASKAVMLFAFCKPEDQFNGELKLKINSTGGIPRLEDDKLNEAKWPKARSITVGGEPAK